MLENKPEELSLFIEDYLNKMWGEEEEEETNVISSPIEHSEHPKDILNTPCR